MPRHVLVYRDVKWDLGAVSSLAAEKAFGKPLGPGAKFLALVAILKGEDLDERVRKATEELTRGFGDVTGKMLLEGIIADLRELGVEAEYGSIIIKNKEEFEKKVERMREALLSTLNELSSPKDKMTALQAFSAMVEEADGCDEHGLEERRTLKM